MRMRQILDLLEGVRYLPSIDNLDFINGEYSDDAIFAEIEVGEDQRSVRIDSITSLKTGQGNARIFVAWLKSNFGYVVVNDPGDEETSPDALAFWHHLERDGLIDEMIS